MKNVWRPVWIMTFASLAAWAAALVIVRTVPPAVAQSTAEPAPDPAAADSAVDDEGPIGAPVAPKEELPPDLRQSADNNVSFPVDI
ncbi:MAG: hypothetical protein AB7G76_09625 [Steroidobacteraceae bacterium]